VANTENPKRYIRKAQTLFKEWRQTTGHPEIVNMAMNFYEWFGALPEPFQEEAFDITKWSFSALNQLTKIPLNLAQYAISEGKNGVRHTIKSIKCLFAGSGKKYLELGQRAEENDWQLVTEKLKKITEDELTSIKAYSIELAQKAQRSVCEAPRKIEPWTDDIIEALKKLDYNYRKLLKPQRKQYTKTQFLEQQQQYEEKLAVQTQIIQQEWLKKQQEYEEKLVAQNQRIQQEIRQQQQQYEDEISTLKQQIENLQKSSPTQPSPQTENNTRPVSQFIPNALVAVVKDNRIVKEGKMIKKVGDKILVKFNDGLTFSHDLTELVFLSQEKSTQKKPPKKSKGFGFSMT
jgi:hypothetical protein